MKPDWITIPSFPVAIIDQYRIASIASPIPSWNLNHIGNMLQGEVIIGAGQTCRAAATSESIATSVAPITSDTMI